MSTRSRIGIRQEDGTILSIYCHWDGYYEAVGLTLYLEYKDAEKVRALMSFGDRSSLLDTPSEEGSYAARDEEDAPGLCCVAALVSSDIYDFETMSCGVGAEFAYLFDQVGEGDGTWDGKTYAWRVATRCEVNCKNNPNFIDLGELLRKNGCLVEVPMMAIATSEDPPPRHVALATSPSASAGWCPEED